MRRISSLAALLLMLSWTYPVSAVFKKKPQPISSTLSETTAQKIDQGKRLSLRERTEVKNAEKARYMELRRKGRR